eukprot:TRINITY_DN23015_c0_g1_i1.p1 TRINITY_DN23015_c0_g1~~TRINITY_DN23015_c0_g1_i1.p1  ORF type:complete len:190 (+),score=36.51 TRINITY_DN23015_c0_g1_i1:63-572(+)
MEGFDPQLQEALDEILRLKDKIRQMEEDGGYSYWLKKAEEVKEREKKVAEREKRVRVWEGWLEADEGSEGSISETLMEECSPPPLPDPLKDYIAEVLRHTREVFTACDMTHTGAAAIPDLRRALRCDPFFRRHFPNLPLLLRHVERHRSAAKLSFPDLRGAVLATLQRT